MVLTEPVLLEPFTHHHLLILQFMFYYFIIQYYFIFSIHIIYYTLKMTFNLFCKKQSKKIQNTKNIQQNYIISDDDLSISEYSCIQKSDKKGREKLLKNQTTLTQQIEKIMTNTLLTDQIQPEIILQIKKTLLHKLKYIIHSSITRSLTKNPKNLIIEEKELLGVAQKMGSKYKTKIGKTLLHMNEFDRDKYPENEIKNLNEINKNHNRQNLKIFSEVYKNNTPERLSHLRSRSIKKDDIEIREDDEVAQDVDDKEAQDITKAKKIKKDKENDRKE